MWDILNGYGSLFGKPEGGLGIDGRIIFAWI
jgi:hypothetical protein